MLQIKQNKTYISIDNGVTGSIGILHSDGGVSFILTPVKLVTNYQKKKKNINRVDFKRLKSTLESYILEPTIVILERPMVNPGRFEATASALRALEATLICLEEIGFPYMFIDSKEWQKKMLPEGIKGSVEQKKASMDIGIRLFPQFEKMIRQHKDADGLLIAEWARRNNL
jgi:hypothetical protein